LTTGRERRFGAALFLCARRAEGICYARRFTQIFPTNAPCLLFKVEIFAVATRQKFPPGGKSCRVMHGPANSRWDAFSGPAQNRCLSESESGAARRLPMGQQGKTPE
jgi:hypothetical protein